MQNNKIIYFAGAIRGDRSLAHVMREIVEFVQGFGLTVLTEHVIADDPIATFAGKVGKEKADLLAEDVERQDIAWLDQATHVIAEISGASTGTGREIEYARTKGSFGKTEARVLCLYHKDREFSASPMVRGMIPDRYPNIAIRSYADVAEAKSLVKKFLEV